MNNCNESSHANESMTVHPRKILAFDPDYQWPYRIIANVMVTKHTKKLTSKMNMKKLPDREARNTRFEETLHQVAVT